MNSSSELPSGWIETTFGAVVQNIPIGKNKLPKSQYKQSGRFPVIDQGRQLIGGYTNRSDKSITANLPLLVFGDHTRVFKYINEPFVPGADGVKVLRPISVHPKWLFHIAQVLDFPHKGYARHYQYLKAARLLVPPLAEQHRIAKAIDEQQPRLQAAVSGLQHADASSRQLRASVLDAAYNGQLLAGESPRRPSKQTKSAADRLATLLSIRRRTWTGQGKYKEPSAPARIAGPHIPNGWTWASLDQLFLNITDGDHQPPPQTRSGVPFLVIGNLRSGEIDFSDTRFVSRAYARSIHPFRKPQKGDILYTLVGSFGMAVHVTTDDEFCVQRHIAILRPHEGSPTGFLAIILNAPFVFQQACAVATGTAQKTVPLAALRRFLVSLPPVHDEELVVERAEKVLSVTRNTHRVILANIARAETLNRSILRFAARGRLVPQNSKESPAETLLVDIQKQRPAQRPKVHERERKPRHRRDAATSPKPVPGKFASRDAADQTDAHRNLKLLRFDLLDDFASLERFNFEFRTPGAAAQPFSPICLVGLNGSGKSNLIEALSEVLCQTELGLLPWNSIHKKRRSSSLRFLLEYEISAAGSQDPVRIRIEKTTLRTPHFTRITPRGEIEVTDFAECLNLLPTWVIGYSSGLNETVSIPYFRTSALYSEEVRNRAKFENRKRGMDTEIRDSRVLYMDYDFNALTLVANFIFQPRARLRIFEEALRLHDIASFDIRFRPTYQRTKEVELTPELESYLESLRRSADSVESGGRFGAKLFRFHNLKTSAQRLRTMFGTGRHFFLALNKLTLLNALALKGRDRRFFLRDSPREGQLERPPAVSPEDRIFSFENIRLQINEPRKVIDYAGISDGEHQFLQVFGTVMLFDQLGSIFLLDEPETHFNPQWRRRFVQYLNDLPNSGAQEFVISTHSPFVVSGCRGEQVIKFERHRAHIQCSKVDFETFGASYDFILARLFDLQSMISGQALEEMRDILKSTSLTRLQDSVADFGESFEKRFLFERIAKLKRSPKKRRR